MPLAIFSLELEQKLVEVWAELLHHTDKEMVTRLEKEKSAMSTGHKYSREIDHERQYTAKEISNKIYSLKKKGRQVYDQVRRQN